jgi:hypothetical protein
MIEVATPRPAKAPLMPQDRSAELKRKLRQQLAMVKPRMFDEMRWHADMVYDALFQLPAVGSPEHPVIAYRGDWTQPVFSPRYGGAMHPIGTARSFLSVSRLLDVAVRFMVENPAGDRKVIVAYQLIGLHARDVSVFSSFPEDQEAVILPRRQARRVSDPALVEAIREALPPEYRNRCEIIVMREV